MKSSVEGLADALEPRPRAVVLTGPPGSGKSAVGRALADALGRPFVDLDQAMEAASGKSVAALFADEGEDAFRARERAAFEAALEAPAPTVIATGGGTLVDARVRRRALREACVLALSAPLHVLVERAARAPGTRPLLQGDPAARLEALLRARAEAYAEAHAVVAADAALPDVVAAAREAVAALQARPTLVVPLGARTYRVHVEPLSELPRRVDALAPSARILVTDENVAAALGEEVFARLKPAARVALPGRGDRDKTVKSLQRVWDAALGAGIDRRAVVVAVGGGVVTDLAGFAAATLLRGVRVASAPTTLLAMVDASVGGKTGVDHAAGKNLIGAFHQPSVVVCDPAALATQDARALRSGMAEVVKVALACDAKLLVELRRRVEPLRALDLRAVASVVPGAIQAKIDVVAEDEREGGLREILNFGHTIGHAIEQAAGYKVPHGECVAIGMRAALDLGVRVGATPKDVAEDATALLDELGMPNRAPRVDVARAEAALASDKKRRDGALRFVLLDALGRASIRPVPREEALLSLRRALEGPVE